MRLRPLHDWVLIRRKDPEERTAGGIIIPDAAKDKPAEGIVEAVGPGRYEKGTGREKERFLATVLKPGQRVFFSAYAARDMTLLHEEITLVREADILGTLEASGEITVKKHFDVEVKGKQPLLVQKKTAAVEKKIPEGKISAKAIKPQAKAKAKETVKTKKTTGTAKIGSGKTEKKKKTEKKERTVKAEKKAVPSKKRAVPTKKKAGLTQRKQAEKKTVRAPKSRVKAPAGKTAARTSASKGLPKKAGQKKKAVKKIAPSKRKTTGKRGNKSGTKAKKSSGKRR